VIDQLRISRFALQVCEAMDVVKDARLIAYVRYVLENYIKEDFLLCKSIDGRVCRWKCSIKLTIF
jgi:hypothetical protein